MKKHAIDFNLLIKQQLKSINVLEGQLEEEDDPFVKQALLKVIIEKYDECFEGAKHSDNYNALHFANLKKSYMKKLERMMKREDL
jgi:hypothetical protein